MNYHAARASVIARHQVHGHFLCPHHNRIGGCHSVIITAPCGEVAIVTSGMCSRLSVSPRPAAPGMVTITQLCKQTQQSGAVPRPPQTSRHGWRKRHNRCQRGTARAVSLICGREISPPKFCRFRKNAYLCRRLQIVKVFTPWGQSVICPAIGAWAIFMPSHYIVLAVAVP